MKSVDIIVLSYNTEDYTTRCLRWLKLHTRYANFTVFVLDNGSSDGSRKSLPKLCLELGFIFLQNEKNVGVSRGWNQVIRNIEDKQGGLDSHYICPLNSDTLVAYGWLSTLVQLMKVKQDVGITSFANLTNPNRYEVCEVPTLSFVCPLIQGEVFTQVGLFNERLFAYFQDNLFVDQARAAGFKIMVTPENRIFHFGNCSGHTLDNPQDVLALDKATYFQILEGKDDR